MQEHTRLTNRYYPQITGGWRMRLTIAWRILWHGEWFPAPHPWYEKLVDFLENPYFVCVHQAVQKADREFGRGKQVRERKRSEVTQWARVYAQEAKLSMDIQEWFINFAREWVVFLTHSHLE